MVRTLAANMCNLESTYLSSPLARAVDTGPYVYNISGNRMTLFKIPVTLWVNGIKVHIEALVDSGATMSFINKQLIKQHNLCHRFSHRQFKSFLFALYTIPTHI